MLLSNIMKILYQLSSISLLTLFFYLILLEFPSLPAFSLPVDNDCNVGSAQDSSEAAPANNKQQGVCSGSFKSCTGGLWVEDYANVANYEATEESCVDGLDNDCDGMTDDADPNCSAPTEEIIVDNNGPGTSYTGEWTISSGAGYYGTESQFSRSINGSYIYETALNGSFIVSEWHTTFPSRCSSVPVEIHDGAELLDTVNVNQRKNGGQWNFLGGPFSFTGQARVTVVSTSALLRNDTRRCTTGADAMKFSKWDSPVNSQPRVSITTPLNGSYFKIGQSITFIGKTNDNEDVNTAAYLTWSSNLDGIIGNGSIFATSALSAGQHTITASVENYGDLTDSASIIITVQAPNNDIIIDNGRPGASPSIGTWNNSSGADYYGTRSVFSRTADGAYNYEAALSGSYDISFWWTSFSTRCTAVPVEIYDGATLLDRVTVNHRENGGQWNLLDGGPYTFTGKARVTVVSTGALLSNDTRGCTTSADAVKFSK